MISLENFKSLKKKLDRQVDALIDETSDGNPNSIKDLQILEEKLRNTYNSSKEIGYYIDISTRLDAKKKLTKEQKNNLGKVLKKYPILIFKF